MIAIAAVMLLATPLAAHASENEGDWRTGRVKGGAVEVRAGTSVKAHSGRSGPESGGEGRGDARGRDEASSDADDARGTPSWCSGGICGWAPATPAPAAPGTPGVSLEEVASFAPTVPAGSMEPGPGIAVRRLPANFISHAEEQIVGATLMGRSAEVRFTPVYYVWETGDGGRVESSKPGTTWARLRAKELSDTATSHRYQERGYYDVRPIVSFEAAYRFDDAPWQSVGELDISGEVMRVRVVTVETRLTRGSCREYPHDPGCD